MRDEEPVLALEREQEVVARDVGDRASLVAEQLPDPVVLVNDVVTDAEVGERLERPPEPRVPPRGPLAEHLRVGKQDDAQVAPDEAAARGRDREQERRALREPVARLEDPGLDLAEHGLRAQRVATVRERDHDAVAGADEARELVLGLAQPAGGDRGSDRLERMRLPARERVELRDAIEVEPGSQLLPGAADLVGLPDEVGPPVERRHQVVGDRERCGAVLVIDQLGLDQVEPPLGGRVDRGLVDGVERALRERREGAHGLDLVPEELDAQRLPPRGRKDVDEAAANRELAAVVDPLDALVAGERELLRELLEAELDAGSEHDRRRALLGGRHPLRERRRRGEHEPPCGEDVERPRTLADEVRRRLEPRLPSHAAARQQRDALRPEEPAGRLGEIPRVAVVRDEHDGLLPARVVQRSEDERKHRLGDPRTLGQRLDVRMEAFGAEELLDERVENRAVHRCGRDGRSRGRPV